jgi:hypothetical protein
MKSRMPENGTSGSVRVEPREGLLYSTTQNEKIELLTEEWAIVGVDVGSEKHYARVFTNRKIELSKKAFGFTNDLDGFQTFERWIAAIVGTYSLSSSCAEWSLQGITGSIWQVI